MDKPGYERLTDFRDASQDAGGHFFDKDTLKSFKTKIYYNTWGPLDGLFITRDMFEETYVYTIRQAHFETIRVRGLVDRYSSLSGARARLRAIRKGNQK